MGGFLQLAYHGIAHGNSGRVRHLDTRFLLQFVKFVKEPVIDLITDAGIVVVIVFVAVAVEPVGQLPLLSQSILFHQAASSSKTRNAIIRVSAVFL